MRKLRDASVFAAGVHSPWAIVRAFRHDAGDASHASGLSRIVNDSTPWLVESFVVALAMTLSASAAEARTACS